MLARFFPVVALGTVVIYEPGQAHQHLHIGTIMSLGCFVHSDGHSTSAYCRLPVGIVVTVVFGVVIIVVCLSTKKWHSSEEVACSESWPCVYNGDKSDASARPGSMGECKETETCGTISECRAVHRGLNISKLQTCRRGQVCCPAPSDGSVDTDEQRSEQSPLTKVTIDGENDKVKLKEQPRIDETTSPPRTEGAQGKLHRNFHLLPRGEDCGHRRTIPRLRITQGEEAHPGQYPWMALLGAEGQWFCSGSLINKRYVLTAAHCLQHYGHKPVATVRLREHEIGKMDSINCRRYPCIKGEPEDFGVEALVVHENWNKSTNGVGMLKNDIALIRLDRDVNIDKEQDIFPICLPLDPDDLLSDINWDAYEIAGWGITDTDDEELAQSPVLLRADVGIRPLVECNICKVGRESYCPLTEEQICVQGRLGKDVCDGDSGGPLAWRSALTFWQVGIVSFGLKDVGCGQQGIPSIFTNVSFYTTWILDNIKE